MAPVPVLRSHAAALRSFIFVYGSQDWHSIHLRYAEELEHPESPACSHESEWDVNGELQQDGAARVYAAGGDGRWFLAQFLMTKLRQ